jgi:hypothetical protein
VKAFLMHAGQDFDLQRELPANTDALVADLELDTLFGAMALGDAFLRDVAQRAVLLSLDDPAAVLYRQQILQDCLEHPETIREIYALAIEALGAPRTGYFSPLLRSPGSILANSVRILELLVGVLRRLHHLAEQCAGEFRSPGFTQLFATITSELGDDYLGEVESHLQALRFRRGVLIGAELGSDAKGINYVLRRLTNGGPGWLAWLASVGRSPGYSFQIADRDEAGAQALGELRDRGLNLAANAVAQSNDHILSFFGLLRAELGFYIAALNLHAQLSQKGAPICFPVPSAPGQAKLSAKGLIDPCLALKLEGTVVGNDLDADGKTLVMVTGANQGGKSTFLRGVGVAQLTMQCGMFVTAELFSADIRDGLFTHFKREEDASLESGKFDEELSRMSEIVEQLTPNGALLCNESFAATNEREGSEIARQIIHALEESGIKVLFVTHMFELAGGLYAQGRGSDHFLRAERGADGQRTFRLLEGEPLATSYGEDAYARVFGETLDAAVSI